MQFGPLLSLTLDLVLAYVDEAGRRHGIGGEVVNHRIRGLGRSMGGLVYRGCVTGVVLLWVHA